MADSMENDKPIQAGWVIANFIIGIVGFLTSWFWGLYLLCIGGVTGYFIFPLLIVFALIPILYNQYRYKGRFRRALWAARIAFFVLLVLPLPLPYIATHFEHNEHFYSAKKFLYAHGVYIGDSHIDEMLPKHLPDECRGYKFKTQVGSIAQDYHPSVYLMFYTDSDTIAEYESLLKEFPNCVRSDETGEYDYGKSFGKYVYPKDFPAHAFAWLDDTHKEEFLDMRNAVVYSKTDTYYGRGCLLDHDSGLVVFWT